MQLPRYPLLIAALMLGLAGPAAAQSFQPPQPQQQQQMPPCFKEFAALRDEAEKKGKAVKAAGDRKAPPQEVCRLFNGLAGAEAKLIKYAEDNSTWCGIPQQVLKQMKDQHGQINKVRDRVCQVAARPAAPAGPSLSDALGTNRVPDSSNVKAGRGGTFDTLTGTPLGAK